MSTEASSDDRPRQYTWSNSSFGKTVAAQRTVDEQGQFFLPFLRQGMHLLDCGCGPGSITAGLAQIVAPGQVVGIDSDPGQIELAQTYAAQQGVTNLRFETGDVYVLSFPDATFDAVFSNALLEHLQDPLAALREMRRVTKPGGVVGVRALDAQGGLFFPSDPLFAQATELLVIKRIQRNGGNPYVGRRLRSLMHQAGFSRVDAFASYDVYGTPERVRIAGIATANLLQEPTFVEQVTSWGWADRETVARMAAAYRAWSESPDAFMTIPLCEAVGWSG